MTSWQEQDCSDSNKKIEGCRCVHQRYQHYSIRVRSGADIVEESSRQAHWQLFCLTILHIATLQPVSSTYTLKCTCLHLNYKSAMYGLTGPNKVNFYKDIIAVRLLSVCQFYLRDDIYIHLQLFPVNSRRWLKAEGSCCDMTVSSTAVTLMDRHDTWSARHELSWTRCSEAADVRCSCRSSSSLQCFGMSVDQYTSMISFLAASDHLGFQNYICGRIL